MDIGLVFALHGYGKFNAGVGRFASSALAPLGVPAPELVAWLMTIAEGIGGILLMVGLLTRLATLPLIAIMIGAILLVKVDVGFIVMNAPGGELNTALLAGLLGLLFIGPGRLSIDAALGMETAVAPVAARHDSRAPTRGEPTD